MARRLILSLFLFAAFLTVVPTTAAAFDPFGHACNSNTSNAVACKTDRGSDSIVAQGPKVLLLNITDVVAYITGALAVIMIVVGALRFITSGSDVSTGSRHDADVEEARRTIAGALIGLLVIILARTIIFYVINKL